MNYRHLSIIFVALFTTFFISIANAQSIFGTTFSYVATAKEPKSLRGAQLMFSYDPQLFQWRRFNIYFDGGYSHFWQNSTPNNKTLEVVSAAPVVRYTFRKLRSIAPFIEFSVGAAYLNNTKIDNRNLGMHFSFQDRMGIGMLFGSREQFLAGIHALHYSNANLCEHNSGITMPLVLDVGYRFQ